MFIVHSIKSKTVWSCHNIWDTEEGWYCNIKQSPDQIYPTKFDSQIKREMEEKPGVSDLLTNRIDHLIKFQAGIRYLWTRQFRS